MSKYSEKQPAKATRSERTTIVPPGSRKRAFGRKAPDAAADERDRDMSIHPRVVKGRTRFPKVNTCAPHKGGGKLKRHRDKLNARRNDHAMTVKTLSARQNPAQYRQPGSLNQRS